MSKNCVCLADRGTLCRLCRTLATLRVAVADLESMDRVADAVVIIDLIVKIRREITETMQAELKA